LSMQTLYLEKSPAHPAHACRFFHSATQTPREVPGKCEVRKLQHKVNEPSARIVPMSCHSFPRELRPRPLRLVAPSHHLVTPNPLECALEVTSCVSAWLDPVYVLGWKKNCFIGRGLAVTSPQRPNSLVCRLLYLMLTLNGVNLSTL
jgi:hypothetical protein